MIDNGRDPSVPPRFIRLRNAVVRRQPGLSWLTPEMVHEFTCGVAFDGVELTVLRATMFFDFDPRLRYGLMRRLALHMVGAPPHRFADALAIAYSALLELWHVHHNGGLSRNNFATAANALRPVLRRFHLPEFGPGHLFTDGRRPQELHGGEP